MLSGLRGGFPRKGVTTPCEVLAAEPRLQWPACYKGGVAMPGMSWPEDNPDEAGQSFDDIRRSLDSCLTEVSQLERALESRDIIGQAKGILMARQSITADAAFEILARASQRSNRKLRDVAADLVANCGCHQPNPPSRSSTPPVCHS